MKKKRKTFLKIKGGGPLSQTYSVSQSIKSEKGKAIGGKLHNKTGKKVLKIHIFEVQTPKILPSPCLSAGLVFFLYLW